MKTVTIDADTFQTIVWPAVALNSPKDVKDLRMSVKVLDKLEDKGTKVWESEESFHFELKNHSASEEFEFEDAEAEHLQDRLEKFLPRLQAWKAAQALPVIDALSREAETA